MLGLTKTISSGLTGLSASGLSLYFIPKYLEDDSQSSKLIYREGISSSGAHVAFFEQKESLILQELEKLYEDFKKVSEYLEIKKGSKHSEIRDIFQKVDSAEEDLKNLYEENRELFEKLLKVSNTIFDKRQEKLKVEASAQKLQYYNKSMSKVREVLTNWKGSVQKIICAIDKDSTSVHCKSNISKLSQIPSPSINSSGGAERHLQKQPLSNLKIHKKYLNKS